MIASQQHNDGARVRWTHTPHGDVAIYIVMKAGVAMSELWFDNRFVASELFAYTLFDALLRGAYDEAAGREISKMVPRSLDAWLQPPIKD